MSLQLFIMNAVVGAFIGAGTNDLAVRAIFRYIIPGKKAVIAGAIQEVVSRDLLSPEKIAGKFASPEVREPLRNNIAEWLDQLLEQNLPSWVELTESRREELSPREETLVREVIERLFLHIASEEFRLATIMPFLSRQWRECRGKCPAELFPSALANIADDSRDWMERLADGPNFRSAIINLLSMLSEERLEKSQTLGDLLPLFLRQTTTDWVADQAPLLLELFAVSLESAKSREALVAVVSKALRDNSASATGFADSIKAFAVEQIADVEGMVARLPGMIRDIEPDTVRPLLRQSLEELWQEHWRRILGDMPPEKIRHSIQYLVILAMQPDHITTCAQTAGEWLERASHTPLEAATAKVPGLEYADDWLERLSLLAQRILVSKYVRRVVEDRVNMLATICKAKPIGRPGRFVDAELRERIVDMLSGLAADTVRERLSGFTEQTGIWDIVGDSINQFDNRELEALIRRIANRELQAVTWLGGVLGAAVGILQTIIVR